VCRAYSPGEFKVLTSTDGGNFEEAACWRSAGRPDAAFEETVLFERPHGAKAVSIVMRSPMPWGYFGINDVALVAEPGPIMLVAAAPSTVGELCLLAEGPTVGAAPCLESIARGTGAEVFRFNDDAQLVSSVTKTCVVLANGDVSTGGKLAMQDCADAAEAGDGRSNFELTSEGQLRFKSMGNYCVSASAAGAAVRDCAAAGGESFAPAAVAELDPAAAAQARDAAALLLAAARRQSGLLTRLQKLLPVLDSCSMVLAGNASMLPKRIVAPGLAAATTTLRESAGPALDAIGRIYAALGVDLPAVKGLIAESAGALASAAAKAGRRA
jgi:hypothetical protein